MSVESVEIMGKVINIFYEPSVRGSWERAVAEAILMSKTCTRSSGVVGDPVTLKGSGSSGAPPFTIIFKKDGSELTRFTGVPEGTQKTFTYLLVSADIGTRRFSQELIDSAGKSCTEYCDVTVTAPLPVCDFGVS